MNNDTNPASDYMDDSDPDMDAFLVALEDGRFAGLEAQCFAGLCDPGCPICHDDHAMLDAVEDADAARWNEDDPDAMLDRYWSGF
jgi:hypothetical protein